MESAAVRILAFLGLATVAVCAALLCVEPLIAALDGALKKCQRIGLVPRMVAVLMAAVATVEAQKSGVGSESDNGFTKRCAEFIVAHNELIKFIRPDEAKTREESLRSARSFAKGLISCGYSPKWLKEFEE